MRRLSFGETGRFSQALRGRMLRKSELGGESRGDKGASLVEYALLVGLIAIISVVGMRVLGRTASQQFSFVGSAINAG